MNNEGMHTHPLPDICTLELLEGKKVECNLSSLETGDFDTTMEKDAVNIIDKEDIEEELDPLQIYIEAGLIDQEEFKRGIKESSRYVGLYVGLSSCGMDEQTIDSCISNIMSMEMQNITNQCSERIAKSNSQMIKNNDV